MNLNNPQIVFSNQTKLGELLISWNIVKTNDLKTAFENSQKSNVPIGKTLVMSGLITETLLKTAIEVQTLIRHGKIDFNQAKSLMNLIVNRKVTLEDALSDLGLSNFIHYSESNTIKLGDILTGAKLITQEQLDAALKQSSNTGLPVGRMLVLCGVLTDSLLTAALNAQVLLRDGKITLSQALEALNETKKRRASVEEVLIEKGFYQLPKRHTLRIGELLVMAKIINEAQLISAIELGLINKKPIGEIFIQSGYINSEDIINVALKLQNMVANDQVTNNQAVHIMNLVYHEKMAFEDAIKTQVKSHSANNINLNNFLQLVGALTGEQLQKIILEGLQDNSILEFIIKKTNAIDSQNLERATECMKYIQSKALTVEHALIAYDFAFKQNLSLPQALKELDWYQGDDIEEHNSEVSLIDMWQNHRNLSIENLNNGNFEIAEKEAFKALLCSEQIENDNPRLALSLDYTADILCRQGKYPLAEPLYKRSLVLKESNLGQSHYVVGTAYSNLAKLYYFQKFYDKAEEFSIKSLEIIEQCCGSGSSDTACALNNLATVYHFQNKFNLAEPIYKRALTICRTNLGNDHPATIRLLKGYSNLLQSINKADTSTQKVASSASITGSWKAVNPQEARLMNW